MDKSDEYLLKQVSNELGTIRNGAYNIRKDRKRNRKKNNRKYKYYYQRR